MGIGSSLLAEINWLECMMSGNFISDNRTMKELQVFKGHKREVQSVSWHPIHENLLVSGGWEGSMMFWLMGYLFH